LRAGVELEQRWHGEDGIVGGVSEGSARLREWVGIVGVGAGWEVVAWVGSGKFVVVNRRHLAAQKLAMLNSRCVLSLVNFLPTTSFG
jgi:hypothetical protein